MYYDLSNSNDDHEGVYQNCKFHESLGRGSCARAWDLCRSWPYRSYSKNTLFFFYNLSKLISIVITT